MQSLEEEFLSIFGEGSTKLLRRNIRKCTKEVIEDGNCSHENYFVESGRNICRSCGCETEILNFDPEWRYYSDQRNGDPSRCHQSKKNDQKSIDKVFVDCKLEHIPLSIRKATEERYRKLVGNQTVRGKGRKARVAACLMFTLRKNGEIRTAEEVRLMFGLDKQAMSEGIHQYYSKFPEDLTETIRPADLVWRVMKKVGLENKHLPSVILIANTLESTDEILIRSNPQSVAAAIVFLYLCLFPRIKRKLGLSRTQFAIKAEISDITITKLVKRAMIVLKQKVEL